MTALDQLRQFIIQTRTDKRLTQREVARRGGIPPGTIGSIEAGNGSTPTQETLQGIARGLGVPYTVLDRIVRGLPPHPAMDLESLITVWSEENPKLRDMLKQAALLPPAKQEAFAAGLGALLAALREDAQR